MRDTVVSPVPSGAGRLFDLVWPDPWATFAASTIGWARNAGNNGSFNTTSVAYGATTADTWGFAAGQTCYVINSVVTPGGHGIKLDNYGRLLIRTGIGGAPGAIAELTGGVVRVMVTMLNTIGPLANHDCGLQIIPSSNAAGLGIFSTAASGFGFNVGVAGGTAVSYIRRGPNGLHSTVIGDAATWHCYEMRIFQATATQEASVQVLIDNAPVAGIPAAALSWAAGTDLPAQNDPNGNNRVGYDVLVCNNGGNAQGLGIALPCGVRIQYAATLQDLL